MPVDRKHQNKEKKFKQHISPPIVKLTKSRGKKIIKINLKIIENLL